MSTSISSRTIVQDEGIIVPSKDAINFTGAGVTVTNVGGAATVVIPGPPASTGLVYKGLWDANANSPALTSGVGTVGNYYIVSTAGTTNLNGTTDWQVGDWAIFVSNSPDEWQKIDNHDVQAYNTVQDEGTPLPQRSTINFKGLGVQAVDNAGVTQVTILEGLPATVYGLFAQTTNSTIVTGTNAELSLIGPGVGTLSVPANGFFVGGSFRGDFGGVFSTGNNQTIRIKVKAGSVILADSGVQGISNVNNDVWNMSINFTVRQVGVATVASIVSLGKFHYSKTVNGTVEGFSFNTVNNTTFDTTISNTLAVTVQFGSNSGANTIYSDIFVLNKIY